MKLLVVLTTAIALVIVGVGSYLASPSPRSAPTPVTRTDVSYSDAEVAALGLPVVAPASFDPATYDGVTPVAFPGDPRSSAARAYLASTARPTGSGYLAFLSVNGYPKPRLRVVVAGAGQVVPGHDHGTHGGWLASHPLVVIR